METFLRFASGGSTVEEFAKDVYMKSNLATRINCALKRMVVDSNEKRRLITESSDDAVDFLHCIEATFLHGLKEKLTLSKVLANKKRVEKRLDIDFWPVVLILSHNQVSDSIMQLVNVSTDVGRCRAWLRLTLNENLLHSYIEALTNDCSLLHGFYRSSAYLRDRDHMDLLKSFLSSLDSLVFQLSYDETNLNYWDAECLSLIGVSVEETPSPVMPAVEALDLIHGSHKRGRKGVDSKRKNRAEKIGKQIVNSEDKEAFACQVSSTSGSDKSAELSVTVNGDVKNEVDKQRENESETNNGVSNHSLPTPSIKLSPPSDESYPTSVESQPTNVAKEPSSPSSVVETVSVGGNSLSNKECWSTLPSGFDTNQESESYDAILQSYSSLAVVSSTPDMRDFSGLNDSDLRPKSQLRRQTPSFKRKNYYAPVKQDNCVGNIMDFEIIPKTVVLDSAEQETQEFLMQITYVANEVGLDEQDYKCYSCGRPIGMVYGKSRVCHFDGFNYCLECHNDNKSLIPARILHNWDFSKYPVADRNYKKLVATDTEAFLDIKIMSPILYKAIPAMNECLMLRTQLFYLHAYLFTCQETVTLELRKLVWPREHLYEHIHLYSCTDLVEVQSGMLSPLLKKAIQLARKHVLSCPLCSQKGFICEICKSSQIIYPFDTESTYRCDKCKAVFHSSCVIIGNEKKPCPRCLRTERRERAQNAY